MRMVKRIASFLRDERGNTLLIAAATMPLMIGGAGLAIDTVQLSLAKRQLQRNADSAAMAGAHAMAQEKQHRPSVERALQLNDDVPLTSPAIIQSPPPAGEVQAGNPNAVRVTLSAARPMNFLSYFVKSPPTITVAATAAVVVDGKFCMISLEDGTETGVTFTGNTTVDIGCGVSSNSRASTAISAGGSATVIASPIMAVGGVPSSSAYVQPTTLLPFAPSQADPFKNLPLPAPTGCGGGANVQPNRTMNLSPGCYNGMDIKGTVNLAPGVYYINGGSFSLGAQAVLNGTGVTIILTSTNAASNPLSVATIDMNGGAVVNLSSPTSGTYEGVLIYEDPRAPLGRTPKINGNSASFIEGAMYFPRSYLTFNGNTGMRTECIQLVARRLTFSGNSKVQNTCPAGGGAKAFDGRQVRLVA